MKIIAAREDNEDIRDRRVWIVEIRHRELKRILNKPGFSSSMNSVGWEADLEAITELPSDLEWYQEKLIEAKQKLEGLLQSIASILGGPLVPPQPEKPLGSNLQRFDNIESLPEEGEKRS